MKEKVSFRFLTGLLMGLLVCAVLWYWQKSTAAGNESLELLDRLAAAQARIRELQAELINSVAMRIEVGKEETTEPTSGPTTAPQSEDLTTIRGIGPVFADRLRQAGLHTIAQVAATNAATLAEILGIPNSRAEVILAESRKSGQ